MIPEYEKKEREMLERGLSWLERLGGIEAVMEEIIILRKRDANLPQEELQRRLILSLYQYIASNPNRDLTAKGIARFLGLRDSRELSRLIKAAFSDKIPSHFWILGSVINTLRREAGVDNSYIEEVVKKYPRLKISYMDITGDVRIPPRIDGNVARSAGWISASSYTEERCDYMKSEGIQTNRRRQYYQLSFKKKNLPFLEFELLPFFEEYFNYTPIIKMGLRETQGVTLWDIKIRIWRRAVVSFYRDVIGVREKREERTILFNGELRRYFIAGLIDIWGRISHHNTIIDLKLSVPSEFKKMIGELVAEFNHKPVITSHKTIIRVSKGRKVVELIEKYPISNPRILFPILWCKERGEFKKWPLTPHTI